MENTNLRLLGEEMHDFLKAVREKKLSYDSIYNFVTINVERDYSGKISYHDRMRKKICIGLEQRFLFDCHVPDEASFLDDIAEIADVLLSGLPRGFSPHDCIEKGYLLEQPAKNESKIIYENAGKTN